MVRLQNIFGTDWMEVFDLFKVPIKTFCNNVDKLSTNTEKLKRGLKATPPPFFQRILDFALK